MENVATMSDVGLIMPMLLAYASVNQRFPSGPSAIPMGPAKGVGMANSAMTWSPG